MLCYNQSVMALRITPEHYAAESACLRPALVARAMQYGLCICDAEDAAGDAIADGLQSLDLYDHSHGNAGLFGWLSAMVRAHCRMFHRSRRRETTISESRWSAIEADDGRALLADAELRAVCKTRLRVAPIAQLDRECLMLHCQGLTQKQIAVRLEISQAAVSRALKRATTVLRSTAVGSMDEPELDHWEWLVGSRVTRYFAPTKTGAQLARTALGLLK